MTQKARHFYEFGHFRLDSLNRLLLKDDKVVKLKPKAVDTLLLLIENRGQVLGTELLMQRLWPDSVVDESNLTQNIYVVRKALGADFIETIPRRGYRFVGEVREVEAESSRAAAAGGIAERSSLPSRPHEHNEAPRDNDLFSAAKEPQDDNRLAPQRSSMRLIWVGTAVGLLIIVIWAGWLLRRRFQERPFFVLDIPTETPRYYEAYGGRVAPDGNRIAFLARAQSSGKRCIFVREFGNEEADPIEEDVSDFTPFFWGYDGTSLYFVTGGF